MTSPTHVLLGAIIILLAVVLVCFAVVVAASTWITVTERIETSRNLRARRRHPSG